LDLRLAGCGEREEGDRERRTGKDLFHCFHSHFSSRLMFI
jgi:hypothetical protein